MIVVLTAVAPAAAVQPVRLDVAPFPAPLRSGPVELRITAETEAQPWRGGVALRGRAGRTEIGLALPAHGRRVVVVPFRVAVGERTLEVAVDGETVARVEVPPPEEGAPRVLVVDGMRGEVSARMVPDSGRMSLPLEHLPETWPTLESFDLVILPPAGEARLRPGQEAALERWVRWGGAVGVPGGRATVSVRGLDRGVTIVGGDIADIERAHAQWRRDTPRDARPAALALWEALPVTSGAGGHWAPAIDPRLAVLAYLALLALLGCVFARFPRIRPVAVPAVALLIAGSSLAIWSVPRAASPTRIEVEEVSLVFASPDGSPPQVSAVVQVTAHRSGTSRFVPRVHGPAVYEASAAAIPGARPHTVRVNADTGLWQRSWALEESTTLRVSGVGPALKVQVVRQGPAVWMLENHGDHSLRSVVVLGGDRPARVLGDLLPGTRSRVDLGTPPGPAAPNALSMPELPELAFWRRLLPSISSRDGRPSPLLLATLDPPLAALEFLEGGVLARTTSHVALPLPVGPVRP